MLNKEKSARIEATSAFLQANLLPAAHLKQGFNFLYKFQD